MFSKQIIFLPILMTLTLFLQHGSGETTILETERDADALAALSLSTDDMTITMGVIDSFYIMSANPVENDVVVYLFSTDTHVATVQPSVSRYRIMVYHIWLLRWIQVFKFKLLYCIKSPRVGGGSHWLMIYRDA